MYLRLIMVCVSLTSQSVVEATSAVLLVCCFMIYNSVEGSSLDLVGEEEQCAVFILVEKSHEQRKTRL